MQVQLSQKERMFLKDLLNHEELCITKYGNYAEQAQDPQLRQLFRDYESTEKQHHDSITQLLQGQKPSMGGSSGQQMQQKQQSGMSSSGQNVNWPMTPETQLSKGSYLSSEADSTLCQDALTTEKFISGAYDTAIFEAADPIVRQTLQHIQQEEQEHGEGIFNYMHAHGMYPVQ